MTDNPIHNLKSRRGLTIDMRVDRVAELSFPFHHLDSRMFGILLHADSKVPCNRFWRTTLVARITYPRTDDTFSWCHCHDGHTWWNLLSQIFQRLGDLIPNGTVVDEPDVDHNSCIWIFDQMESHNDQKYDEERNFLSCHHHDSCWRWMRMSAAHLLFLQSNSR